MRFIVHILGGSRGGMMFLPLSFSTILYWAQTIAQ
ncbi:uncharacterized protein METZ01_LOCUS469920 [marine metagenome]|uniref:Uncharacterized protein n=1 Tax=marine metagenome TaxID=408172 RepID=A0A383BA60_9ZZZZ